MKTRLLLLTSMFLAILMSGSLQSQNVGIDVDPPLSKLHINGGILATGTIGSTPVSGTGTRLMWVPDKKAFRAGYAAGNVWDNANIGSYSIAMGNNCKASSECSVSLGKDNNASGVWSVALGTNNTSSGLLSFTMGGGNQATNGYSIAMGGASIASGYNAFALGDNATATGSYSRTLGLQTTAQAYGSVVIGRYNVVEGTTDSWISSDPLFVIGNGLDGSNRNNALTILKNGNTNLDGDIDIAGIYKQDGDTILTLSASSTSTHLGKESGTSNTGAFNTIIGYQAAKNISSGSSNTAIGYGAGYYLNDGVGNVLIGEAAGLNTNSGQGNVFIGLYSGEDNTSGLLNTYLGLESGKNATGSYNVFLGYRAGFNESGSNKLHINNTGTGSSLIYGDFSTDRIGINTNFPLATLDVNGDVIADSFTGDGSGLTNLPIDQSYWTKEIGILYTDSLFLGLGTAIPDEQLHVNGKIKIEDNVMLNGNYLSNDGDNEGLFVTTDGKLGVGLTNPNQQVELTGSFQIPNSSDASTGVIYKNGSRFIHNFKASTATGLNTFMGIDAGNFSMSGTTYLGSSNSGFGAATLQSLTSGYENTAVGRRALQNLTQGYENTAIGYRSMENSIQTIRNVAIGNYALQSSTGYENIAIGYMAGKNITSGHGNIIIGTDVDAPSTTTNGHLNIGNTIYGDLSNKYVGIDISNPTETLHVNGTLKLASGVAVNKISTDASLAGDSDMTVPTEKAIKDYVDNQTTYQPYVPIGSIIAWAKDITGVTTLDTNYVECNGQTLSDPLSPLNGQAIPDLNGVQPSGKQRFLRGGSASGMTGGSETHTHEVEGYTSGPNSVATDMETCYVVNCSSRANDDHEHQVDITSSETSTLPSYYEVVWIMRVK